MAVHILAITISFATGILYLRSKQRSAMAMLIGVFLFWSAAGLTRFGAEVAESTPHPDGSGRMMRTATYTKPLPIVEPMFALSGVLFAGGFVLFAWQSGARNGN